MPFAGPDRYLPQALSPSALDHETNQRPPLTQRGAQCGAILKGPHFWRASATDNSKSCGGPKGYECRPPRFRWSRLFDSVTRPRRFVTVRIGRRAISMGKSRLQGAAPTAVNVTVRRRGPRISDRTRGRAPGRSGPHQGALTCAQGQGRDARVPPRQKRAGGLREPDIGPGLSWAFPTWSLFSACARLGQFYADETPMPGDRRRSGEIASGSLPFIFTGDPFSAPCNNNNWLGSRPISGPSFTSSLLMVASSSSSVTSSLFPALMSPARRTAESCA